MKKITSLLILICISMLLTARAEAAMSVEEFFKLCREGTPQQIEAAIKQGANVNARDNYGWMPLKVVLWERERGIDKKGVLSVLIKAGADVNAKDKEGWTNFMAAACLENDPEVLNIFIQAGAEVNAKDDEFGTTALMLAVADYVNWGDRDTNPEFLRTLIRAGADVNAKDEDGKTALIGAVSVNADIINILIQSGAEVDAKDNNGRTPLMRAAQYGDDPEVLKALIKAGADVNAKNNDGATPLILAVLENEWGDGKPRANNMEFLNILIQAGANVNAKDNEGRTALTFATEKNREAALLNILTQRPVANAKDIIGRAAQVTQRTYPELIEELPRDDMNIDGFVRLAIKGTNVNLRPQPHVAGNVVAQMNTGDIFIAEKNPVINDDDKSLWYKITLAVEAGSNTILALPEKDSRFNSNAVFVREDFATISPLEKDDLERILTTLRIEAAKKAGYVRLAINGTNVNLRPQPRAAGRVVAQMNTGDVFFAEKWSITLDDDKSQWYKIVLPAPDFGKIEPLCDWDKRFVANVAYVRADFANISPLKEDDIERILATPVGRGYSYNVAPNTNEFDTMVKSGFIPLSPVCSIKNRTEIFEDNPQLSRTPVIGRYEQGTHVRIVGMEPKGLYYIAADPNFSKPVGYVKAEDISVEHYEPDERKNSAWLGFNSYSVMSVGANLPEIVSKLGEAKIERNAFEFLGMYVIYTSVATPDFEATFYEYLPEPEGTMESHLSLAVNYFITCTAKRNGALIGLIRIGHDDKNSVKKLLGEPHIENKDSWYWDNEFNHLGVSFDENGRVLSVTIEARAAS